MAKMNQESPENLQACINCVYYHELAQGGGDCRRYPPVFVGSDTSNERHHWKHPRVFQHAWCGEFRSRGEG